jgi:hypothetical protein
MEQCWDADPDKRSSGFDEIGQRLQDVILALPTAMEGGTSLPAAMAATTFLGLTKHNAAKKPTAPKKPTPSSEPEPSHSRGEKELVFSNPMLEACQVRTIESNTPPTGSTEARKVASLDIFKNQDLKKQMGRHHSHSTGDHKLSRGAGGGTWQSLNADLRGGEELPWQDTGIVATSERSGDKGMGKEEGEGNQAAL